MVILTLGTRVAWYSEKSVRGTVTREADEPGRYHGRVEITWDHRADPFWYQPGYLIPLTPLECLAEQAP